MGNHLLAATAPGSNRTFMELKLAWRYMISHLMRCSNRTFMELKYEGIVFIDGLLADVLIVPLWN